MPAQTGLQGDAPIMHPISNRRYVGRCGGLVNSSPGSLAQVLDEMETRYGDQARSNLRREITSLAGMVEV